MDNRNTSAGQPIAVQVCYAETDRQIMVDMTVAEGTRLIEAIRQSGIEKELSIAVKESQVGIFGKKKPFGTVLGAGDRIEIYRPLAATPQELRRRRLQNTSEA